ncbi:SEC-C domain-containing protein [Paenibacillus sp. P96]|uniref:SEC-C domain-containing protein n=1 Tax=Paenibacillus zeirhizosphaerae TaxID=2987519 RepID=A0ABT9FLM3_9BACL|nr:SEC-C domain-containing protein [Paenibacillus sp. P96]MDP4095641.1 SEC-C domain-containing protein [Paenibacillus sp. P96]
MSSIGRNQLCPCGSGKKYKYCHIDKPLDLGASMSELNHLKNEVLKNIRGHVEIYDTRDMLSHFPNHKELIQKMYQAIDRVSELPLERNPEHIPGTQIFNRVHSSALGNIQFAWSVPILESFIKSHDLSLQDFKVAELMNFIDPSVLVKDRLQHAASNNEPVYVIEYQAIELERWAVDGNHRIAARFAKDKESKIKGYCFSEELHMKAIMYDFMRVAYAIRANIVKAFGYRDNKKLPTLLPMD